MPAVDDVVPNMRVALRGSFDSCPSWRVLISPLVDRLRLLAQMTRCTRSAKTVAPVSWELVSQVRFRNGILRLAPKSGARIA